MGETYERLGPFRLIRRLGVGGMAEAFEACRASPGGLVQRVCIKRVLPAYAADPSFVRLFRKEAETASRLHHASIVAVLGVGEDEGHAYLVLELVDGIDLRALLASSPDKRLPPRVVVYVATELAFALAYAHAGDSAMRRPAIVHRDLSPSNVLLGRGGEVKLADFGLARAVDGQQVTQSGEMRGKIPYMAPEQMRGGSVTASADLFSLGVLLFEALSGARPFDGSHDVETMMRVLGDQRQHLLDVAPDTPGPLAAIVERLLAHDPRERFRDAHEVLEALAFFGALDAERFALADRVEAQLGGPTSRAHVASGSRSESASVAPHEAPRALVDPNDSTHTARPRRADSSVPRDASASEERAASAIRSTATSGQDDLPSVIVDIDTRETEPVSLLDVPGFSPRRRVPFALALSALLSVAVGATWTARSREVSAVNEAPRPASAAPKAAVPAPEPARIDEPAPEPARVDEPPHVTTESAPATDTMPTPPTEPVAEAPAVRAPTDVVPDTARASVRVVVHPWGSVWVDHRLVGRAPRTVALPPGTHLVEAGHDAPMTGRRVALEPRERRTLELDLELEP